MVYLLYIIKSTGTKIIEYINGGSETQYRGQTKIKQTYRTKQQIYKSSSSIGLRNKKVKCEH